MLYGNGLLLLFRLYILRAGKRKGHAEIEWVGAEISWRGLTPAKNGKAIAKSAERDSYNVLNPPLPNPIFQFHIYSPLVPESHCSIFISFTPYLFPTIISRLYFLWFTGSGSGYFGRFAFIGMLRLAGNEVMRLISRYG